jgi:hypothetical protein
MTFKNLAFEEMIKEAKRRAPDDKLRILAEVAEKKVDDAWQDGYDHGHFDSVAVVLGVVCGVAFVVLLA